MINPLSFASRLLAALSPKMLGMLLILVGTACFAAKGIVIKLAYREGISAEPLLALRMLFALPFYIAIAIWVQGQSATPLTRPLWIKLIALGILSYYLSSLLDFMGLQYISAGLERLILYIYPTMVLVILAFWKKQTIKPFEKIAMLIAYAGMFLVFAHDLRLNSDWQSIALGGGLVFMSTLTFAFFVVMAGDTIPQVGAVRFTAYAMMAACVGAISHTLLQEGFASLVQTHKIYALSLVLAVFCTVIPSLLMNKGIGLIGSGKAALLGSIGPVITLFLGAMFLDEAITLVQLAGAALVIGGVSLSAKK